MNGNKRLPLEIERKYLIKMPDVSLLEKQPLYMRIEMEQAYLRDFGDNSGMRIRKSTLNGKTSYKKTYKKSISFMTRIEIEDDISEQSGQLFELDIYPFWNDRATLEIELSAENENFELPPFIEVIKEVTDDDRYKNRSLSYEIVNEEI